MKKISNFLFLNFLIISCSILERKPSYLLLRSLELGIVAFVKNTDFKSKPQYDLYLRNELKQFQYLGNTTFPPNMIRVYGSESLVAFECRIQLVTQWKVNYFGGREFCDKDNEEEIQNIIKIDEFEIGILIDKGIPGYSTMRYIVIDQTGKVKRSLKFSNFIQILFHSNSTGLIIRNGDYILRYDSQLNLIPEAKILLDAFDYVNVFEDKITIFNRQNFNFKIFRLNKVNTSFKFKNILNVNVTPIHQVLSLFPFEGNIFFETKSKNLCGAKLTEIENQVYCTDLDDYLLSENIYQKDEKNFVSESYNLSLEQKKNVEFEFFQNSIKIIKKSTESLRFKPK